MERRREVRRGARSCDGGTLKASGEGPKARRCRRGSLLSNEAVVEGIVLGAAHGAWRVRIAGEEKIQNPSCAQVPIAYNTFLRADVAQLVEHNLAKVGVAGSNPVVRSI